MRVMGTLQHVQGESCCKMRSCSYSEDSAFQWPSTFILFRGHFVMYIDKITNVCRKTKDKITNEIRIKFTGNQLFLKKEIDDVVYVPKEI